MSKKSAWNRYDQEWGNYISDKHKTKKSLKEEIRDILTMGSFDRADLIEIKDIAKGLGFKEQMVKEDPIGSPEENSEKAMVILQDQIKKINKSKRR